MLGVDPGRERGRRLEVEPADADRQAREALAGPRATAVRRTSRSRHAGSGAARARFDGRPRRAGTACRGDARSRPASSSRSARPRARARAGCRRDVCTARDGDCGALVDHEVAARLPRPCHEECAGFGREHCLRIGVRRKRQRRQRRDVLASQPERLPARGQHRHPRRVGRRLGHERGDRGYEMLAVVEDEQDMLVLEELLEADVDGAPCGGVSFSAAAMASCRSAGSGTLASSRTRHRPRTAEQLGTDLERESRLADAADSHDRDQRGAR